MKFTSQQYAQALFDAVSESSPKDHDFVLDRFVNILAQQGDLGKRDQIEQEYKKLDMAMRGITQAKATFARDPGPEIIETLNQAVKNKAEFRIKIEEEIIGGVIIKADETLIDASVKKQLEDLNRQLKQS